MRREALALTLNDPHIQVLSEVSRKCRLWLSPNLYILNQNRFYDMSLMFDHDGSLRGASKMVHIAQAKYFYEQDYYTPSDDGFKVYDTPFGKIGVVICFDRHLPDGVRSCAKCGAELIIIPTANIIGEPLELFEWEIRVQAFQNTVYIAMCNRVGTEGNITFAGQSLLAGPDGSLLYKADGEERLISLDVPLESVRAIRENRPWLNL